MNGYSNLNVNFKTNDDMKLKQKNLYYGIDANEAKEEEPDDMIINEWIATKLADKYDLNMYVPGDIIIDSDNTETEEESNSSKSENEEEVLYNSEESETEDESGSESDVLSSIKEIASKDNQLMVDRAMESYKLEFGEYPSLELLEQGLYNVGRSLLNGYEKESEEELNSESESDILYEDKNVMSFSDELENVLLIASKIGSIDQEYLANQVLSTYYEVNKEEASLDELSNIFENVKNEFQYEAMDDILEEICSDDESDDDDYFVTKNEIIQAVLDELDSEDEEYENSCETERESDSSEDDSDDDSSYDPTNDLQDYCADHELYE